MWWLFLESLGVQPILSTFSYARNPFCHSCKLCHSPVRLYLLTWTMVGVVIWYRNTCPRGSGLATKIRLRTSLIPGQILIHYTRLHDKWCVKIFISETYSIDIVTTFVWILFFLFLLRVTFLCQDGIFATRCMYHRLTHKQLLVVHLDWLEI